MSIRPSSNRDRGATARRRTLAVAALLALIGVHPVAQALPEDSAQPIQIQADRAELDERKGTATYIGAVHLTQGTLNVLSDRLVISSTNGVVMRIEAQGTKTPARYSQRAKVDQPPLQADARTITYLTRDKRIKLSGNAHLTQGKNTFAGATIDYDIANQFVSANGSGGGGVRVTIDPSRIDAGKTGPAKDPGKLPGAKGDGDAAAKNAPVAVGRLPADAAKTP